MITSPNENFEYYYSHSNALLQFELKMQRCKPHKAARHPTKCDVINDVKLFLTVYGRIYCRKYLTLSNQRSHYKLKCIRIVVYPFYCMALFHSQMRRHMINSVISLPDVMSCVITSHLNLFSFRKAKSC